MPTLVEGNQETGILKNTLKNKFQFKHNVKIVGGAGDNAAAAAGMGITETKQSFVSLGTSGVFLRQLKIFLVIRVMLFTLFVIACLISGI